MKTLSSTFSATTWTKFLSYNYVLQLGDAKMKMRSFDVNITTTNHIVLTTGTMSRFSASWYSTSLTSEVSSSNINWRGSSAGSAPIQRQILRT